MDSYSVKAVLSATDNGFTSTFAKAGKATELLGGSIGGTLKNGVLLGAGMKAVGMAMDTVSASMGSAIARFDTLQKFPKVMKQMGFSAKDASEASDKMAAAIDGLPTSLDAITSSAQSIALLTGDLKSGTDTAIALNDAFLASGSSAGDAARGLTQYTQMLSSGKVDMQSWKTLLETMSPALTKVAKSFGYTGKSAKQDLYKALQSGEITFDQLNKRIIELDGGVDGFAKLARTQSAGIQTSFTNMKLAVVKGLADMLKTIDTALQDNGFGTLASQIDKGKYIIKSAFAQINGVIASVDFKGIAAAAKPYWDAFSSAIQKVGSVLKTVGTFFAQNAGTITKIGIPLLLVAAGFRGLMVVSSVIAPLMQISGVFSKLAGGVLARLAPQLFMTATAEEAAGAGAGMAAGNMLRMGAAVLMIGAGIALACVGFALLAQSAIQLASAGTPAIATMFGMVGAMGALMGVAALCGAALTAGAVGLIAFGAAVTLIGAGVLLASAGIAIMAGSLPMVAATAGTAATGLLKLAAASTALVAASAVFVAASGSLLALGAAGATAGAALLLVAKSVTKLAGNASTAANGLAKVSVALMMLKVGAAAQAAAAIAAVSTTLQRGATTAFSLGANLSKGFARGMRSQLSTISSAANSIVKQAEKVIKAKAKIASPSRLTRELGGYFGEGFAVGITGSTKLIRQAAAKMVSVPNVAMSDGLAFAGSLNDNYSYGVVEVPLYINGREFAKATSSDMQDEINTRTKLKNRKNGKV